MHIKLEARLLKFWMFVSFSPKYVAIFVETSVYIQLIESVCNAVQCRSNTLYANIDLDVLLIAS